jgi:hypothetical protein
VPEKNKLEEDFIDVRPEISECWLQELLYDAFRVCALEYTHFFMGVCHKTGQQIPDSGIYRVTHQQHRLPHEVTLLKGETFPRCAKCGDMVEFELVQSVPYHRDRTSFCVRLYALPDLDDEGPVSPLGLGIAG